MLYGKSHVPLAEKLLHAGSHTVVKSPGLKRGFSFSSFFFLLFFFIFYPILASFALVVEKGIHHYLVII